MSSEKHLGSKALLIVVSISVLLSGGSYAEKQKPVSAGSRKDPLLECLNTIDARYKIAIKEVTQVEENFKALLGKETP
jgi:hypothetical protein